MQKAVISGVIFMAGSGVAFVSLVFPDQEATGIPWLVARFFFFFFSSSRHMIQHLAELASDFTFLSLTAARKDSAFKIPVVTLTNFSECSEDILVSQSMHLYLHL